MNLIEFANPVGWWAALVAVPVVVLYILKTRMRQQQISTLLFWDQIFDEKRPRAWWQQLRRVLSLLLQLAFLLLLVAALVDPLWSWQRRQQRSIVLVIDNSASMQAIESDQATRIDRAKQTARVLVRSLRGKDQMAVLTAGETPRVVLGMTDHQNSLIAAIEGVTPTDGPTVIAEAIELANRLLSNAEGDTETIVLTDGAIDMDEAVVNYPNVALYGVGTELDNIGITRYQVRRSVLDAVGYQVLVDVTNYSDAEAACRLTITQGDDLVDVVPLTFAAGETATRVLDHTSVEGGSLIATLDADDALAIDNRAVGLLPPRDPVPVVLVTDGNLFLESVLRSIPLVSLQVQDKPPTAAPVDGVLVLDRLVPAILPSGRVMVVDPGGGCDLWTLGEAIDEPIVADVDSESPLTQHVRLTNVLFPGARELRFSAESEALIQDPLDRPLLARIERRTGDAVVLTCNLEQGDLPLRIAFPVLMKNAIEWFQGDSGDLLVSASSGQMVTVNLQCIWRNDESSAAAVPGEHALDDESAMVEAAEDGPAKQFIIESPSGKQTPIVASQPELRIGPLSEVGTWQVHGEGESASDDESDEVAVACNLTNRSESDLRPRVELQDPEQLNPMSLGGHSLWFYITLVGLGLITTEWWLYQRRIVE